jgi:hypothetical protein
MQLRGFLPAVIFYEAAGPEILGPMECIAELDFSAMRDVNGMN